MLNRLATQIMWSESDAVHSNCNVTIIMDKRVTTDQINIFLTLKYCKWLQLLKILHIKPGGINYAFQWAIWDTDDVNI